MKPVKIRNVTIGSGHPPVIIAGPCVIESEELLLSTAARARDIVRAFGFSYVLKSSFEKANRTSIDSYRGPGITKGLKILAEARTELKIPVLTDIHLPKQAKPASQKVDCLQIPAFLCRQTELIESAAKTGLPVNIKKAQFMSPVGMKHAAEKAASAGNGGVLITERGTSFGYGDLVVDMRAFIQLAETGCPIIFDATHSVQKPSSESQTGGNPRFTTPLACAAAATGAIDGIFIEVHPNPAKALSDAGSQLPLDELEPLLERLKRIFTAVGRF
ncbi:3-deoxy-8-phosphooctulonate synthase [candidate division LCP-89 bacterium B3_LCP]|uniref:3-deoxy-8-phosphooctulonate synthase n=1 Tax=candidate division LCP-89 bacterium B3_LCP TaxID=2012998 RepID=A0A532UZU6_UNCL8|nr:MAG: 3-deoxy-8-phosphooctulonate synthase [candidate division LCP-89 bacterium B3_LCP]